MKIEEEKKRGSYKPRFDGGGIAAAERVYICDLCSKIFNRKFNLRSHITTHVSKKQHQCTDCGKLFQRSQNLNRHRKNHYKTHLEPPSVDAPQIITDELADNCSSFYRKYFTNINILARSISSFYIIKPFIIQLLSSVKRNLNLLLIK